MLPNWIIIGAPKAATSSLFRWLVEHPQVAGSADKETYYCVDPGTHMFRADRNFRDHGLQGYERLFADADRSAEVVVEATPSYLYSSTALQELPHLPSRPNFIVVIREPLAQLGSLYSYFQQNWNWIPRDMTFGEFIAAVEEGGHDFRGNELAANALSNAWYPEHLRRWQSAVGAERMLILLFEDVVDQSRRTMRGIADRMGIDPCFYDSYDFPRDNSTYAVRYGVIQDLNVRLRGHIPKGPLYDRLRRLYRAINTRPAAADERDAAVERRLAQRYSPMLVELERDFALDMSGWRAALAAATGRCSSLAADIVPAAPRSEAEQPSLSASVRGGGRWN